MTSCPHRSQATLFFKFRAQRVLSARKRTNMLSPSQMIGDLAVARDELPDEYNTIQAEYQTLPNPSKTLAEAQRKQAIRERQLALMEV